MRYPKKAFAACVLTAVLGLIIWSDSNTVFAQGVRMDRIVNPYPVPNPNYVPNPVVVTPIVPAPMVPSPVVPSLNVSPNGPWTPGYPVLQPIFPPPPVVIGPMFIVTR